MLEMSKKIKVLFIITQSEAGGAQRFLNELIPNLDKNKYDLLLAAGERGNWESFEDLDVETIKLKNAKRNISLINDIKVVFEIRKLVKKHQPDVLFLNSSKTSIWGPLAVYLPIRLKPTPKIIYRIGGWSFNDPQSPLVRRLRITLERLFAWFKDYIIVNNLHDFKQAEQLKIKPKRKVALIHNGINVEALSFLSREEARQKLNLSPEEFIVGTIANFYKTKGLKYLIEAAAKINDKNIKFVIIGDGRERKNLEHLINQYNLGGRVKLLGKKKNAHQYIKAFDVFILPSVKEGFPWVILEAAAAEVPIIATNVGAIPEIIEDEKSGIIIEPKKPQQIVRALDKIQSLNTADQAHQIILQKFTLKRMTSEIERVIDL